jgi:hypothetical protein
MKIMKNIKLLSKQLAHLNNHPQIDKNSHRTSASCLYCTYKTDISCVVARQHQTTMS